MVASVSAQCRARITTLKTIVSSLSDPDRQRSRIHHEQVSDELERFSLWMGNIGALHRPKSSMSLESRLREANDVLTHILQLLDDLNEVAGELLEIVSGERKGEVASAPHDNGDEKDQNEETELLGEIGACITRFFRVSSLIRQAAPTDLFAKALSRNRYRFNDQFDIAHVGEKYPKLATQELAWLQKRLGRAITQRRHYLSYIQDHREKLEGMLTREETSEPVTPESQAPAKQLQAVKLLPDSSSRPSTFFTKASSLTPGHITPQMLAAEEESDPENDARSYTTISRSIDGDLDSSTTVRIPKLDELRAGSNKEVECPFCFRMEKFKNERVWRRHVFSDLRSYVCTFPDCDAPYFGDINEWFRHEMQNHRVSYTCRLCQKTFQLRERYLAHVRKQHPDMLEDGEQQPVLDIARKPLDQIPAQECPCCSEWVNRLKERAVASTPSDASYHILGVVPTVFKRHLASHLEQLALFAIPIGSAAEGDVDSNVAIEEGVGALLGGSDLSILTFDSSRPSSPASKGQLSDGVPITEGVVKAAAGNEGNGRDVMTFLLDRRRGDVLITEEVVRAAAGHEESGKEVMTLLLDRRGANVLITEGAVAWIAKSFNEEVMMLLLDQRGDEIKITEEVAKAAVGNEGSGREVMTLLLDQRDVPITEGVVKVAAGNKMCGKEIMTLLLDRRGGNVPITEGVVKAAVGNWGCGKEIITLLLDRRGRDVPITEGVVKAAAGNEMYGKEIITLFDRRGGNVLITKGVVKGPQGADLHAAIPEKPVVTPKNIPWMYTPEFVKGDPVNVVVRENGCLVRRKLWISDTRPSSQKVEYQLSEQSGGSFRSGMWISEDKLTAA